MTQQPPKQADTSAASDQEALAISQDMQQAQRAYAGRDWAEATRLCRKILAARADHFDALSLAGIIAAQSGRMEEAAGLLERAVEAKPGDAAAHCNYGNLLNYLRRFENALGSYTRALEIKPDYAEACHNRGVTLHELGRFEEALASFAQALEIRPAYAQACYHRGATLQRLKRYDEALACYTAALQIKPDDVAAWYNRGVTLHELRRFEEALDSHARALQIKPDFAEASNNRGVTLQELKRFDEALESFTRALQIKPEYPEACNNRGVTLQELGRFEEALESFTRALQLRPDYAEAYNNRGNALQALKRFEEALESFTQASRLKPDSAEARYNRGNALQELKRFEEALDSYAGALQLNPGYDWLLGMWLHTKMLLSDWSNFDSSVADLAASLRQGRRSAPSFPVIGLIDSLSLQRRAAEISVDARYPVSHLLPAIDKRKRRGKIRIGYFSADFRDHPVAYLIAELFELHDREKFELVAFSYGPDSRDGMRRRLAAAFEQFLDVGTRSDVEVARVSRDLQIDIAVDLTGLTQGGRSGILSHRAAPIQVNYLGYPGTMGAQFIDYIIADRILVPPEARQHYAEKVVYLPNSYQVNDRKRQIADRVFTRAELGLPASGFVFCCFNNTYKITPATFAGWMRILTQVENSVLWLAGTNETAAGNLRKEAAARGVSSGRLLFAPRLASPAEHLARYRAADLFIDTLPYNAHATASDALWAGLPVLTLTGESYAARVGASLLNAIGLPELITTTQQQYEALAIELANNPGRLAEIRARLRNNRLSAPLFDTELFTRHLEDAYRQMYERYQADQSPEDFGVAG